MLGRDAAMFIFMAPALAYITHIRFNRGSGEFLSLEVEGVLQDRRPGNIFGFIPSHWGRL